jgi:hypothetical protein
LDAVRLFDVRLRLSVADGLKAHRFCFACTAACIFSTRGGKRTFARGAFLVGKRSPLRLT